MYLQSHVTCQVIGHVRAGEWPEATTLTAHAAAQRILALATESLDMMKNVTGVVRDSLGCAEAYVFQFFLC